MSDSLLLEVKCLILQGWVYMGQSLYCGNSLSDDLGGEVMVKLAFGYPKQPSMAVCQC